MTVTAASLLQIPQDKLQQCINSGAISSLMITTAAIGQLAVKNIIGHVNVQSRICIVLVPFIGRSIFLHYIPETDPVAINLAATIGMGCANLIGQTPLGFATGSLIGGLAGVAIAASSVRALHQE